MTEHFATLRELETYYSVADAVDMFMMFAEKRSREQDEMKRLQAEKNNAGP